MPEKKAHSISNGLFLISLGILFYTGLWWPGILLAVWLAMASKQYLTGRYYDAFISSVVLLGLFMSTLINVKWAYLLPTLFIVAGVFLIYREYNTPEREDVDIDGK